MLNNSVGFIVEVEMRDQVLAILKEVFPENIAQKRLETHLKTTGRGFTIAKLLKKYSYDEALDLYIQKVERDKKKGTLERYIERYGEIEGKRRYLEKNKRLSVGVEALKNKGLSEAEIQEIKERHSKKSANTKENFIERHGKERGIQLFQRYETEHRSRSCWCEEFWIERGLSLDEAKEKVSEKQRRDYEHFESKGWTDQEYIEYCKRKTHAFSLEGYQERYGDEEGQIRWYYDREKGSNLKYFKEKYGDEKGVKKYKEMLSKKVWTGNNSKIQLEFASELYNRLPSNLQEYVYGEPIRKSFMIPVLHDSIKLIIPDIRIKNILIEFDGSYWHSLPEVMERDKMKDILTHRMGFITFRVDEREYIDNKPEVIDQIIQKITSNINLEYTFKENYESYKHSKK